MDVQAATAPLSLSMLSFSIIALTVVTVVALVTGYVSFRAGVIRGRDASARELDGLATPLRLDASEWRLVAYEKPYRGEDQSARLSIRQDRSRMAVRSTGALQRGDTEWAGEGIVVGDEIALICVETGSNGRRTSTLLLQAHGDELRGIRITKSKHPDSALVHPVQLTRR